MLAGPEALWRQIEPLLPALEEVYFAGGEPLVMEEHERILRFLIDRRLFHVRLIYNTNFSVMAYRGSDFVRMWDRFETVRIGARLDAIRDEDFRRTFSELSELMKPAAREWA